MHWRQLGRQKQYHHRRYGGEMVRLRYYRSLHAVFWDAWLTQEVRVHCLPRLDFSERGEDLSTKLIAMSLIDWT